MERFGAKATKARQAQSRLKQIEKIEIGQLETTSRRAPHFQFLPQRASGRDVLEIDKVSKAYGENRVLENVSLTVRRGERVAILGANGLGKSTLLKIATGRLETDGGNVKWGHEAHVGYFPQDHHEVLLDARRHRSTSYGRSSRPKRPATFAGSSDGSSSRVKPSRRTSRPYPEAKRRASSFAA